MKKLFLSFTAMLILASCGSNEQKTSGDTMTQSSENEAANKSLQQKMNVYVQALNEISVPLIKGYNYYMGYVKDTAVGPQGEHIYFMPEVNDADFILQKVEKVSKEDPKAEIDRWAAGYISASGSVVQLHNELSRYYGNKENLVDKEAKGKQLYPQYVSAFKKFREASAQLSTAYDKYYKESNAAYLKALEKNGDKIRFTANRLMNTAEALKSDLDKALYADDNAMPAEMDKVQQSSSRLQADIDEYGNALKGATDEDLRKFFNHTSKAQFERFERESNTFLKDLRGFIEAATKENTSDFTFNNSYKEVGRSYDRMINAFNASQF